MPNRMLRDWTDSYKMNQLSVHAERFFIRLIMKADDYGCFYADTKRLKATLFPFLLDTIREADISRWITELINVTNEKGEKSGLIILYESEGKKYLQIQEFKQRLDRARAKFPLPEKQDVNNSQELVNEIPPEVEKETEVEKEDERKSGKPETHSQEDLNLFKKFQEFIKTDAPNVAKMKEPFTIDQFKSSLQKFGRDKLKDIVIKMHNWKPLLQKNVSAYLTLNNWSKKEFNEAAKVFNQPGQLSQAVKQIENGR